MSQIRNRFDIKQSILEEEKIGRKMPNFFNDNDEIKPLKGFPWVRSCAPKKDDTFPAICIQFLPFYFYFRYLSMIITHAMKGKAGSQNNPAANTKREPSRQAAEDGSLSETYRFLYSSSQTIHIVPSGISFLCLFISYSYQNTPGYK